MKKHLLDFFSGTLAPLNYCDLMAVKIEEDQTYLIIKSKYACIGKGNKIPSPAAVLDEEHFSCLIKQSTMPIVFSDRYVDLNSADRFATMIALYGISYANEGVYFNMPFKYIRIKEEYRAEYERIPNLVGKTHLPLKVIGEVGNTVKVEYGCEQILNGTYDIILTEDGLKFIDDIKNRFNKP